MTAKLLLVDDEPGVREAVTAYLEDSGFEVTAVANGQAALAYLETNVPDLIITDIMMPQIGWLCLFGNSTPTAPS